MIFSAVFFDLKIDAHVFDLSIVIPNVAKAGGLQSQGVCFAMFFMQP